MKALIDLFNTFEALGDETVFVNRTGMRRLVVSYGKLTVTFWRAAVVSLRRTGRNYENDASGSGKFLKTSPFLSQAHQHIT